MDQLFDESLEQEFITESREHLDSIEPELLALEQGGQQATPELINKVFRAIHSIKGGAGFLAYDSLKALSHQMENVLMKMRDGELELSRGILDVLFRSIDRLRMMLDDLAHSAQIDCSGELADLRGILGLDAEGPATRSAPRQDLSARLALFAPEELKAAFETGAHRFFFLVELRPVEDFGGAVGGADSLKENLLSLGAVILPGGETAIDPFLEGKEPFCLLFKTVLDEDMAQVALGLPAARVTTVTADDLARSLARPAVNVVAQENAPGEPGAEQRRTPRAEAVETLRVRLDLLTNLMNNAGELVLARNQMFSLLESVAEKEPEIAALLQNIDRVTANVQEGVMQARLQPVGGVIGKFPRIVRDVARSLQKEIDVELVGTEVEVDRSVNELIADPLTHIIRNACDHAVEKPAERIAAGKPAHGKITIKASHEGGQVILSVSDDGRGIDHEKIRRSAISKGIITEEQANRMGADEIKGLIFAPGFSTADTITDVSGRGVGMDVVRTNIEKLGGTVEVTSVLGEGTTVWLRIPLTLAIIPVLMVGVEDQQFGVPQLSVEEILWIRAADCKHCIERLHQKDILHLRGSLLPVVRLRDVLEMYPTFIHPETGERETDRRRLIADRRSTLRGDDEWQGERRQGDRRKHWRGDHRVVIVKAGKHRYGIVVDKLFDSESIVIKPLSLHLKSCRCFSGAAITGDGAVITVLDVAGIAALSDLHVPDGRTEEQSPAQDAGEQREPVVLFRVAGTELFAVPQSGLMRLEKIGLEDIQSVGGHEYVTYRGRSLPVVRVEKHINCGHFPKDRAHGFLLIPKSAGEHPAGGILVSEIVDAMELAPANETSPLSGSGVVGSRVVDGTLITYIEPANLLRAASSN